MWAVGYSSTGGTLALQVGRLGMVDGGQPEPGRSQLPARRDGGGQTTTSSWSARRTSRHSSQRWDGEDVEIEPSADAGIGTNDLNGVHVGTADDVWAVGTVEHGTLTQHWDGTKFSIIESPSREGRDNILEDVDGTGPDDVWAVGHHDNIDFIGSRTVAMHWDGSRWRTAPTPKRGGRYSQTRLVAVDTIAPDDAWAVGSRGDHAVPEAGHPPLERHEVAPGAERVRGRAVWVSRRSRPTTSGRWADRRRAAGTGGTGQQSRSTRPIRNPSST